MTTLDPIIIDQLDGLLTGETNPITVLANASALLNDSISELNWAGFYLYNGKTGQLDLGPFQGKVACMHIQPGKGVVGTSYQQNSALLTSMNLPVTSLAIQPATPKSSYRSTLMAKPLPSWTLTPRNSTVLAKMMNRS